MVEEPAPIYPRLDALRRELRELEAALRLPRGAARAPVDTPLSALVLELGPLRVALLAQQVLTVTPMVLVTPLAGAPAPVRGTIGLRGQRLPVLDLRVALTGEAAPLRPEHTLVLTAAGPRRYALCATACEQVAHFDADAVEVGGVATSLPPVIRCLLRTPGGAVPLLDPAVLLAAGELQLLDDLLGEWRAQGDGEG